MVSTVHRMAIVGASAMAPLAFVTVVAPGISSAVECGWGTVFDPPSNTWNGDVTPYFSIGICAPIPFVSICTGI